MPRLSLAIAIIVAAACGSARAAQQAPVGLPTIGFADGVEFVIERPYDYVIGSTRTSITVPQGFVTDFASIPALLRGILERQGRYSRAAVIHDYLYWTQACTRLQSDNLLMIAMKESGVSAVQRAEVYKGVRLGGAAAWKANARERLRKYPRVVPADRFDLVNRHTWSEARKILIAAGIEDPAFVVDQRACALGNTTDVP